MSDISSSFDSGINCMTFQYLITNVTETNENNNICDECIFFRRIQMKI